MVNWNEEILKDFIRKYIKENLKVVVEDREPYNSDIYNIGIDLVLDEEIISSDNYLIWKN